MEESTNSTDARQFLNESQAVSVDGEPKLRLKKIDDIRDKVKVNFTVTITFVPVS